jgi:CheY-like chemotaxis protein
MILIVEDESIARNALSHLLHHSGFEIQAAASAEEALEIVDQCGAPEVALVDLDLPGMDGLELIGHLSKQNPDVLSVLITAAPPERVEQLKRGDASPDRYLRKPLKVADLLGLLTDLPRHD